MSDVQSIIIVPNCNNSSILRIKTVWENNFFQLTILEGTSAWFALITKADTKVLADQHKLDVNVYFSNLKMHLCNNTATTSFDIVKKQFVIYGNIDGLRIKYFFTDLETIDYQKCVEEIIDQLYSINMMLVEGLNGCKEEKIKAEEKAILFETKCREIIKLKKESREELLGCFVPVLNEKKKRIRYLTEVLNAYQFGRKPITRPDVAVDQEQAQVTETTLGNHKRNKTRVETISESESSQSDNYQTDEENNTSTDREEPAPSTSRGTISILRSPSPSQTILPKRRRSNKSIKECVAHSARNVGKSVESQATSGGANDGVQNLTMDEDSPTLDFSTQDLLDRL